MTVRCPPSGFSTLNLVGSWKPDALANLTQSKNRKHAILYEQYGQANHVSCPSQLIHTANSRMTVCTFFGCWLTLQWQILVSLSHCHHPKTLPISCLTLHCASSRAYGSEWGQLLRKLQQPTSCLTVWMMASHSLFLGTSQKNLNLPRPAISLCTTNHVGV